MCNDPNPIEKGVLHARSTVWCLAVHLNNKLFKAGTIFSSYVYTGSTTTSSWSSYIVMRARCSELQNLWSFYDFCLTPPKVPFSGTGLCPSAPEGPPSHFRERGLQGMRHKHEASLVLLLTKLLSSSSLGFPIFLTPCNTSQVDFSCNSMHSASHHNVLLPPYVPNIFSTVYHLPGLGPFLVPTSAPYSARRTLPAWLAAAATVAAPALHKCWLAIWHGRPTAQAVTAFQWLVDQAE